MKKAKLALCSVAAAFMVAGCATAGNLVVTGAADSLSGIRTVEVKCGPGLFYEWLDSPDLKTVLLRRIKARLKASGFKVVEERPDLTIVIQEIRTEDEVVYYDVAKVVVVGIRDGQEVLRVEYSQKVESLTLQAALRPSKTKNQVADLLAGNIIREIRGRRR